MRKIILSVICILSLSFFAFAQDHNHHDHDGHNHDGHDHASHAGHDHSKHDKNTKHDHHCHACGTHEDVEHFDPGATAFHHISDQNVYNIGPIQLPLPCILYAKGEGWSFFSSGRFEADSHGNGCKSYKGYVLDGGLVKRVTDSSFPRTETAVQIGGILHKEVEINGEKRNKSYVCYNGKQYPTDKQSTLDGGLFGGGLTSFYDFSITKNVVSMILVCLFLAWLFFSIAKTYREREGKAPTGKQSLLEPVITFIRDEVAKPFIGHKWSKFFPFLLCLFFFILGLNLFGQIPFFGGSNVTGNLAVTMVLAILAFIVTNINGNKHYWEHIFAMPGVPKWVLVILTPVEVLGIFIKPITLMLRLFANITAGHMVMVIFVGLIFVFGKGQTGASLGTAVGSTLLTMFMMAIELIVAFIQAFVFTILTASYIGAATEEAHH